MAWVPPPLPYFPSHSQDLLAHLHYKKDCLDCLEIAHLCMWILEAGLRHTSGKGKHLPFHRTVGKET